MLHKTRYEGAYYRINRRGLKVFEARLKIAKKEYRRKIGEEPQYNANCKSKTLGVETAKSTLIAIHEKLK